ncbi:MAG TPA: hypothetical protein VF271_02755 [Rhodanobacteraceae bacterium]
MILAAIVWPAWATWRWRHGWRLAAAVPAVVMGFVLLRIVFGAMIDATSHNPWPFELLMVGVPSLIWMAVVALVRRHRKIEGTV